MSAGLFYLPLPPGFTEWRSGEFPCVSVRSLCCLRADRRERARPPCPLVAASVCFCLPLPPGFTELRSGEFPCVSVLSSCRPAGESKATRPLSPLTNRSRPLRPSGDRRRAALPGGAATLRGVLPLRPLRSLASTRTRAKGPWRPYPLLPRWRGIPERMRRRSPRLGDMVFLQRLFLSRWRGIPERVRRRSSPLGGTAFLQGPQGRSV